MSRLRHLDIATLRLFLAVVDHQSMARAAAQEHLTASAVSKRMAQLEHSVGLPLFLRGQHGVVPTEAGTALVERARAIIIQTDRIDQDIEAFNNGCKGPDLRVVASPSILAGCLPDDIAGFLSQPLYQDARVSIEEATACDVIRRVQGDRSAIGVCRISGVDMLESRPYREDELWLAVPPNHELAACENVSLETALNFELIGLPATNAVQTIVVHAASAFNRRVAHRVATSTFDSAIRLVAAGFGICFVPRCFGIASAEAGKIALVPLGDTCRIRKSFINFNSDLPALGKDLIDYLSAAASQSR